MFTRRSFLQSSTGALAARLFAAPPGSTQPNPQLENLGAAALREAKKLKASYCDIRIVRYRRQVLSMALNPQRGTGKTFEVPSVSDGSSFGFGVRVIAGGAWGFAASPFVNADEIARVTREAVGVARANAALKSKPVQLAPVAAYRRRWQTPHERDPFSVSIDEKLELIRSFSDEFTVFGEVGEKDPDALLAPYRWVEMIKGALDAGARWVICEGRATGDTGLYRPDGEARTGLIDEILHEVDPVRLIFEAPKKHQQVWFIQLLGPQANLGNILPGDVISLETLRLGLRADTLELFHGRG